VLSVSPRTIAAAVPIIVTAAMFANMETGLGRIPSAMPTARFRRLGRIAGPSNRAGRTARTATNAPVAMTPTPRWALAACATVVKPRRFCPAECRWTRQRGWTMIFHFAVAGRRALLLIY
jgi:hypothetical protein